MKNDVRAYYVVGNKNKTKIFNSEDDFGNPIQIEVDIEIPLRLTVVSNLTKKGTDHILEYGWTFLNSNGSDRQDKSYGRDEAKIRLLNKEIFYGKFTVDEPKFKRIAKTILTEIAMHKSTPYAYLPLIEDELSKYNDITRYYIDEIGDPEEFVEVSFWESLKNWWCNN